MTTPSWTARYHTTDPDKPARTALLAIVDRHGHTEHAHALLDAHAAEVLAANDRPEEAKLHRIAADTNAREADFYAGRLSTYALEAEIDRLTRENARLRAELATKAQP
jgi:hypothetical protein